MAKDSDTLEEKIIYRALYADEFPYGQLWVRPAKDFLGKTIDKIAGKEVKRFTLKQ